MLSKYVKSLLEAHSRVIVPDLGAFMLKGDSLKSVYFNEFLRFNDGLLVDHIAEKDRIDKAAASNKVKEYVDGINKQLSSKKSVDLEGIGTLFLDANDKLQLKELGGVAPVAAKPEIVQAPANEVKADTEKPKNVPPPVPTPKAEPLKSSPITEKKVVSEIKEKQVTPPKSEPDKKPQGAPLRTSELTRTAPKKGGKVAVFVILGILVFGAAAYMLFLRPHKKDANINQNITFSDSAENKKQSSTVAPSNPEVATQGNEMSSGSRKYYVVTGSFIVESNADRMLNKLLGQGYHAEKLISESGRFHFVTISSFSDRMSAIDEVNRKKAEGHEGAWIYSY